MPSASPQHQHSNVDPEWWNGTRPSSFFRTTYFIGDDSIEGHRMDVELDRENRTIDEVHGILQALRPMVGPDVLDCPCGEGRHAIRLATVHGRKVTGIDLCKEAIEKAKSNAQQAGDTHTVWLTGDMREIPVSAESFDFALNMFFSFGFFAKEDDNIEVAKEYYRVLRPSGRLLIHTDVNPSRIESGNYKDRSVRTLKDGSELRVMEQYDSGSKRLIGSWTIINSRRQMQESSYSVRIYTHEELEDMLRRVGFDSFTVRPFRSTEGATVDTSQEIAYIAGKA